MSSIILLRMNSRSGESLVFVSADPPSHMSTTSSLVAGGLSGALPALYLARIFTLLGLFADALVHPVDTIRSRLQVQVTNLLCSSQLPSAAQDLTLSTVPRSAVLNTYFDMKVFVLSTKDSAQVPETSQVRLSFDTH